MNATELKINVPAGYEIDKENSTFECIKFKPIQEVRTWKDIKRIKGAYINSDSDIDDIQCSKDEYDKNIFINEKHAKSALAMAQISQLMPYYGGAITDEEWRDDNMPKYCIDRSIDHSNHYIELTSNYYFYRFLAFRTKEQRERFMSYEDNINLVMDYLMID